MRNKKSVVIIGAGFGGIACALELLRLRSGFKITIIDQRDYHLIRGNLYELASAPEELNDLVELKHTVSIPIKQIFAGKSVEFRQAKVINIDTQRQEVELDHGRVPYDYLVSSLGSHPNFYSIPGAEDLAIPLHDLGDALKIRNAIEFAVERHRTDVNKDVIRIMIAGGSVSGIEIAAEFSGMVDFIAWKNNYPREKIETVIIEGAHQLVPGLAANVAKDIQNRLESLGVKVLTGRMIQEVGDSMATFTNGEKMEFDVLIWAAGVKARHLPMTPLPESDHTDRVEVDEYFRIKNLSNVFVVGDQACHHMADGRPLPGTASQAIDQGTYIAGAITKFSANRQPLSHVCKEYPYVIPLGGKWGVIKSKNYYVKGYPAFLVRQWIWIWYYADLLGPWTAARLFLFNREIYSKND
jgi:NADH:ubiquinone reductase (H+-translocating)